MTRTELELQAAVEADEELREKLTEQFNLRGRSLGWFTANANKPEVLYLRDDAREPAFEFLMGAHAALIAAGLHGFHGMELMVASTRGADFVFPIERREPEPTSELDDEPQDDRCG